MRILALDPTRGRLPLDIGQDGVADVLRKRQAHLAAGLAAHMQHTRCPIDILNFQRGDVTSSKPQASQKKQDRPVTEPTIGELIA